MPNDEPTKSESIPYESVKTEITNEERSSPSDNPLTERSTETIGPESPPLFSRPNLLISSRSEFSLKVLRLIEGRVDESVESDKRKFLDSIAEILETISSHSTSFSPESKDKILLKLFDYVDLAFGMEDKIARLEAVVDDKVKINLWINNLLREQHALLDVPIEDLKTIFSPSAAGRVSFFLKNNPRLAISQLKKGLQEGVASIHDQWAKVKLIPGRDASILFIKCLDIPEKNLGQTIKEITCWNPLAAYVQHYMNQPHDIEKQNKWAIIEDIQREIESASQKGKLTSDDYNQMNNLYMLAYFALCIDDDLIELNKAKSKEEIQTWIDAFLIKIRPFEDQTHQTIYKEHLFGLDFAAKQTNSRVSISDLKKEIIGVLGLGLKNLALQWKKVKDISGEIEQQNAMYSIFNSENVLNSPKFYFTTISCFHEWDPDPLVYFINNTMKNIDMSGSQEDVLQSVLTHNALSATELFSTHPKTAVLYAELISTGGNDKAILVKLIAAKIELFISEEDKIVTLLSAFIPNKKIFTDYLRSDKFILALVRAENLAPTLTSEEEPRKLLIKRELARLTTASTSTVALGLFAQENKDTPPLTSLGSDSATNSPTRTPAPPKT
ncbi:hypothetical protein [Legionella sainthelensi]|uniref:Uncharacterized protein n=1 Tax=Legionella sainthelensi TaxID=28087 RepID=A0A2H5FM32_9GAMM|nr:hypothetical protein [Legionella sainthelensi]AUH72560.1 hypothetical protein CAB17_11165 [Legionella sainthelensi]